MITQEKIDELYHRMINHGVDANGNAIVEVSARELDDLLRTAVACLALLRSLDKTP